MRKRKSPPKPSPPAKEPRRNQLDLALDLQWLAHELELSANADELLHRFNARAQAARYHLLVAQGKPESVAAEQSKKSIISRARLDALVARLQSIAIDRASTITRDTALARAIEEEERNRRRLAGIIERAIKICDDEGNAYGLMVALKAIAQDGEALARILHYQGVREMPMATSEDLAAKGGPEQLILELARALPEKAGQLAGVLARLIEATKREEIAKGAPRIAAGLPERPVVWTAKVIGTGEN